MSSSDASSMQHQIAKLCDEGCGKQACHLLHLVGCVYSLPDTSSVPQLERNKWHSIAVTIVVTIVTTIVTSVFTIVTSPPN